MTPPPPPQPPLRACGLEILKWFGLKRPRTCNVNICPNKDTVYALCLPNSECVRLYCDAKKVLGLFTHHK